MFLTPLQAVLLGKRPASGGGGGDPFFANVTVLYGFNQASISGGVTNDGSLGDGTIFDINESETENTTVYNGSHSCGFNTVTNDSNDGIDLGTQPNVIGSGNFTVEGFCFCPTGTATNQIFFCVGGTLASSRMVCNLIQTTQIVSMTYNTSTTVNSSAGAFPLDAWFHMAVVFESGVAISGFVDGVNVVTGANTFSRAGNAYTGRHNVVTSPLSGVQFLDEYRVTTLARYGVGGFTPPSGAFPRST